MCDKHLAAIGLRTDDTQGPPSITPSAITALSASLKGGRLEEERDFLAPVWARLLKKQLSTNNSSPHVAWWWHIRGKKNRMRDDHHSDRGDKSDKGTLDPSAQTVPAGFPGDGRLSAFDLCTCSLTRTSPEWGNDLLYTWGRVFPDRTRAYTMCS